MTWLIGEVSYSIEAQKREEKRQAYEKEQIRQRQMAEQAQRQRISAFENSTFTRAVYNEIMKKVLKDNCGKFIFIRIRLSI